MKLLWSYLRQYLGLVALALVLAAVNQVFSLLDPLIFRHVIDSYAMRFREYSTGAFIREAGLLLLAAVAGLRVARGQELQDYFISVITQRLGRSSRGRHPPPWPCPTRSSRTSAAGRPWASCRRSARTSSG